MLRLSRSQSQAPLLFDRENLIADIVEYLDEYDPQIVSAYPQGYLNGIVNESLKIAFSFQLYDIVHLRVFTRLRWEISAGFFKQVKINEVLSDKNITEEDKFSRLLSPEFDDAWEEAQIYDGPDEWRGYLWENKE